MAEGLREVVLDGLGWRGRHRVEEDWGLLVRLRFQLRDEDGLVQGREHVVLPAHRGEHPGLRPRGGHARRRHLDDRRQGLQIRLLRGMPQSLIDERREEDGTQCLKLQRGVMRMRIALLAGFVAIALLGGCAASISVHAVDQGPAGLDERVMETMKKAARYDQMGLDVATLKNTGITPASNAYLIVGLIPHYTLEDGQLRKDMFDIAVLMQNERVVACQEALYWVPQNDSDPNIEGAIAYPRWRNAPFDGYELLLAEGVPLAEIAIRNGADEADWLVRPRWCGGSGRGEWF